MIKQKPIDDLYKEMKENDLDPEEYNKEILFVAADNKKLKPNKDIIISSYVINTIQKAKDRISYVQELWNNITSNSGTLAIFAETIENVDKEAEDNNYQKELDGYLIGGDKFKMGYSYIDLINLISMSIPYKETGMINNFTTDEYSGILVRKVKHDNKN